MVNKTHDTKAVSSLGRGELPESLARDQVFRKEAEKIVVLGK